MMLHSIFLFFLSAAASAESLPFEEAVALITSESTEVSKARLDRESSQVKKSQAKQNFLPNLSGKSTLTRSLTAETGLSTANENRIVSELNLFRFGQDKARFDAASLEEQIALLEQRQTMIATEQKVATALIEYIEVEKLLAVAQNVARLRTHALEVAKKQYEKGLRPSQDLDKLTIDQLVEENKVQELDQRKVDVIGLIRTFSAKEILPKVEWPLQTNGNLPVTPSLRRSPQNAEHLEKKILTLRLQAAEAQIDLNRGQMMPSLDLSGEYGTRRDYTSDQFQRGWGTSLTLTVPLYNRSVDYTAYRLQSLAREKISQDLLALERTLASESATVAQNIELSLRGIKTAEEAFRRAERLQAQSSLAFQKGVLSVNDLNTDQHRFYDAQANFIRSWSFAHKAFLKACRAQSTPLKECL